MENTLWQDMSLESQNLILELPSSVNSASKRKCKTNEHIQPCCKENKSNNKVVTPTHGSEVLAVTFSVVVGVCNASK